MIYDYLFERSDSALNPFEMLYDYLIEMIFQKATFLCTPAACSEFLSIESWPNSIGKNPAEKKSVDPFEMIYDYRFEMSGAVLYSFRYDIWLSFRNDGAKIFVQRIIFVSEGGLKSRDENAP